MHSLPIFVRLSGQQVILLGEGDAADAKRRLLERAGAKIITDPDADARIAFVALDGPAAENAAAHLRARGLLVNVVDRPDLCDFTTPAIVDRDPVLVAIGTGGASAGLAKALRQRLERNLPGTLGPLAQALESARDTIRRRWPDGGDRRRAIDTALDEGGFLDPFGKGDGEAVSHWLSNTEARASGAGQILTICLDSPDPEQMTVREARLLGRADAIWHDENVPGAILDRARADATRHQSGDAPTVEAVGPGQLILWVRMAVQSSQSSASSERSNM